MKKKTLRTAAAILTIAAIAVLGYSLFKKKKVDGPQYRTETLAKGNIEALVITSGTVNPVDIVEIGSQVSGKISKLNADFNSQVTAGQIVAELEQDLLRAKLEQNEANYRSQLARLEQAKVTLENAQKKYERTLDLFQRDLVSFEERETAEANHVGAKVGLQTAEASVATAKSQLDASKVDLSYAIIRSPINGTVITRNVNVGQTVAASLNAPILFKVASDLTKMQVECSIDEADIGRVEEGQKVRFTVDAFPNENFTGVIRQVRNSPVTQQNVVTYTTIVDASNESGKLRPGMTATVQIVTGEALNALRLPNAALRFTPDLPAEELQRLYAEMRGQMGGGNGQPGTKPAEGQPAVTGATPATAGTRQGGGLREGGAALTPEALQKMAAQRTRRQANQVWVLDEAGKLKPYFVRTGVTDNTYSELLGGNLQEGMTVILGIQTAAATTANIQQQRGMPGGGPGGMMFIGR